MGDKNKVEIVIGARDEASGVLSSLTAKMAGFASLVASYFGVSLFSSAVKGAADLEEGMSRVQAASAATAQEMDALRKAATDAGATTKFTATEAASALENLTKSGLSAKDSIVALPAVLNLAQAGGIGLAEASSFLTQAVKGMGLEFSDSARVADVLAKGANASSTSVTGLASALSYTAPVAKAAKLSLEETVAIIGKFADGGIDASRAGTALNSILAQFIDPSSKFRAELAGAGIVTSDFSQALRQLAAAGAKGQQAILAVGLESGPALRTLLNQGIGALDDLKGKLDNSAGSAAKTAAVMENNLKGAFSSLGSAWDTVKIALGQPVLPVLTSAVQELTKGIGDAVSNGTIGRFGTAIATSFESAIKWVKGFAGAVDFTDLAARLQGFADRTGEAMSSLGKQANTAGEYFRLAYGVMSGGVNTVLSAVYFLGSAFAGVLAGLQTGLAALYEGFSKITFGSLSRQYKEIAADIRLSADATTASALAMGQKSQQAFEAAATSGTMAKTAFQAIATSANDSVPAQKASAAAIGNVAVKLQEMAEANAKASAATTKQKEEVEKTIVAVAKLKTEYEAAMAAGDIQLAAQKQQQLREQLVKTGAQAKFTEDELKALFNGLGVTSQATLKQSADAAQVLFEKLKASGQGTALDLQNAFAEVAKRTLAASGDIGSVGRVMAESSLKAKAAAEGLSLEFDNAGKAIVRAMGQGGAVVDGMTTSINISADAAKAQEEAFDRMAMRYKLRADYTERQIALEEKELALLERKDALERKRLNVDKEGFSLDKSGSRLTATESQEQLKARVGGKFGAEFAEDKQAIEASNIARQLDQLRVGGGTNNQETTDLIAKLAKLEEGIAKTRAENAKEKAKLEKEKAQAKTDKYEKSLSSFSDNFGRNEAAISGQSTSREKEIALNLEQLASVLALAKANNDLDGVERAQLALTKAKLASQRELASINRAEADALRTRAAQQESYAQAANILTPENAAAILALRQKARQKDLEADRSDLVTQREEDLPRPRTSANAPAQPSAPVTPTSGTTQTYLVKIEFSDGRSGSFNAASNADALGAVAVIKELASAKRAAGY